MSFLQITLIIFGGFLVLYLLTLGLAKWGYSKLDKQPAVPFKIAATTLGIIGLSAAVAIEIVVGIIYFVVDIIKS